jgi:hypothetical protein
VFTEELVPNEPPVIVQLVAYEEVHLSVVEPGVTTVVGLAEKLVMVGAGVDTTVTNTDAFDTPQVTEYVVVVVGYSVIEPDSELLSSGSNVSLQGVE